MAWVPSLALAAVVAVAASSAAAQDADCARERAAMVDIVRAHARSDPKALPSGMSDKVLEAMGRTLRHRFIPDGNCAVGYLDRPLPIGHSSTISQPYIVALMTELAAVPPDGVALEIGTGSGYQAAILAQLDAQGLHRRDRAAARRHVGAECCASSATTTSTCGSATAIRAGRSADRSMPSSSPPRSGEIPPPLIEQLKVGGKLVMPVGSPGQVQLLMVVDKVAPDKTTMRAVTAVRFVPFSGRSSLAPGRPGTMARPQNSC